MHFAQLRRNVGIFFYSKTPLLSLPVKKKNVALTATSMKMNICTKFRYLSRKVGFAPTIAMKHGMDPQVQICKMEKSDLGTQWNLCK